MCVCETTWFIIIQLLMHLNTRMSDCINTPSNVESFKTQHKFLLICSSKTTLHLHWLATLHLIFLGGFFPAIIQLLARKKQPNSRVCWCVVIEHHRIVTTSVQPRTGKWHPMTSGKTSEFSGNVLPQAEILPSSIRSDYLTITFREPHQFSMGNR